MCQHCAGEVTSIICVGTYEFKLLCRCNRQLSLSSVRITLDINLQIYGESLRPDVPYKTLLLSVRDNALAVVREMLDKYGLHKEDPSNYCLMQVGGASVRHFYWLGCTSVSVAYAMSGICKCLHCWHWCTVSILKVCIAATACMEVFERCITQH